MSFVQQRDRLVADFCDDKTLSLDEIRLHFAHHLSQPAMEHLPTPCGDCAVTGGLYTCVSALLSLLPPDEVAFHSDRWFCHNHGDRACRGNANYQRAAALTPQQRDTEGTGR
ncbi:hypothetical protein [Tardiphaga sp.]|uniref:hypothetical protein n=1 Tax=Tardiphaga sp. TaxID=1926292 RepID=UPI0026224E50|nr:hypothetical protein [Tardiphaga sp.]MDB5616044.1 hypothetical protein [Tardiphaga sp.]